MSALVFASVHGAPGVTTTAQAVAGCLPRPLLVEADASGGVLAVRYGLGREPGLTTLAAAAADAAAGEVWDHTQELPGGARLLVGPDAPQRAAALWRRAGVRLARLLDAVEGSVVVDAGRLYPESPALSVLEAGGARLLWVVRPTAESLVAAAHRLEELRGRAPAGVVLVGHRPYGPDEVARELRCEVVGVVAHDPRGAAVFTHGGSERALRRSLLARSVRTLADSLADASGVSSGGEAVGAASAGEVRQ